MYDNGFNLNRRIKINAVAMTTKIQRYFYKSVTFYLLKFHHKRLTTCNFFFFFDRLPAENYMRAIATSLTKKINTFSLSCKQTYMSLTNGVSCFATKLLLTVIC